MKYKSMSTDDEKKKTKKINKSWGKMNVENQGVIHWIIVSNSSILQSEMVLITYVSFATDFYIGKL